MLVIFDFNQSIKNNYIYSYGIINIIWYKTIEWSHLSAIDADQFTENFCKNYSKRWTYH